MTFRTSTAPSGPVVTPTGVTFRFPDPDTRLAGVRLAQQVRVPGDRLDFTRHGGTWQLTLPRPPVGRMEYLLELRTRTAASRRSATRPTRCGRRARSGTSRCWSSPTTGRRPGWTRRCCRGGGDRAAGALARTCGPRSRSRLWAPADAGPTEQLPLLVAHDGPEYDALSGADRRTRRR